MEAFTRRIHCDNGWEVVDEQGPHRLGGAELLQEIDILDALHGGGKHLGGAADGREIDRAALRKRAPCRVPHASFSDDCTDSIAP